MKIIEDQNNGGDTLAILRVFSSHSCLGQGHYSVVLLSRQEKPAKREETQFKTSCSIKRSKLILKSLEN